MNNKLSNRSLFSILAIVAVFLIRILAYYVEIDKKKSYSQYEIIDDNTSDDYYPDEEIEYFSNFHSWEDYYGAEFSANFKVNKDYFKSSKYNRENPIINNNVDLSDNFILFYYLYENVLSYDKSKLNSILYMFDKIRYENNLNRKEFAELIVSSIQAIPYAYILASNCDELYFYDDSTDCMGNVYAGFQSPVEFMSNFKGDCDTRALLCFCILDRFNYDVAIMLSEVYEHAVLGINLNIGGGDYLKKRGKRYYAWETTSEGWKAGNLPVEVSNMVYWKINITNNDLNF